MDSENCPSLRLTASDITEVFAAGNAAWRPQPSRLRCSATLPHPVAARGDIFLHNIRDAVIGVGHEASLADPDTGEVAIMEAIRDIYAGHPQAAWAQWGDMNRAMYAAVCLTHAERGGIILRATDALEMLLAHTDVDAEMPISLFQPPHPALYVHFGPTWRSRVHGVLGPVLALADAKPEQVVAHGCYLLQSRKYCPSCGQTNRAIGLYVVVEFLDQPGIYVLGGGADETLHDEDAPLTDILVRKLDGSDEIKLFGELPSVLVDLLAKLFLFMQSDAARCVRHDDLAAMTLRLANVGSKKAAKLQRRGERLYDWLEIGPPALPSVFGHGELPPHWRRGHLRRQTHGPQHSLRKVIFIAPTVIRADKLNAQSDFGS